MRLSLVGLGALTLFSACGDGEAGPDAAAGGFVDAQPARDGGAPTDAGSGADPDAQAPDADMLAPDAEAPVVIDAFTVTPTSARLSSLNGSRPTASFRFTAHYTDGSTVAVTDASVRIEPQLMGTFERASGVFTATGRVGGDGELIATFEGLEARAALHVEVEQIVLDTMTSSNTPQLFLRPAVTDPAREAQLVYPLDEAVMPQNVQPAELQWLRSAPGDVFRVRIQKPNVRVVAFVSADAPGFRDSWKVLLDGWRRIAQSEPSAFATITVDRYEAATQEIIRGVPVRVRFARAALQGSVYYWAINAGRVVRIDDATGQPEQFMPNPLQGCIGCHSVSTNGRYLAARWGGGDNVGSVLDLTQNLTSSPPPLAWALTGTSARWFFSAWSPDDTRLLTSYGEMGGPRGLRVLDPFTGNAVPPAAGTLPEGAVSMPVWSPDGAEIAYVGNANAWGGAMSAGDIFILPVTGQDSYGTPYRILTGTTAVGEPQGSSASYPTWQPDSAKLAFAHGDSSRSESGRSALYLMNRDGTGVVRLDKACGGASTFLDYQPRFSPFEQDGYFWLSFLSRRDYGNARAGTRGTSRQQIWVSAIKANPMPGEDPSEVGFWLPGQETSSQNISAYWAPRACREDMESCGVDAECCSGECEADACIPSTMCRPLGEKCVSNAQCCQGLLCVDGFCN